jgi:hypothetical protein
MTEREKAPHGAPERGQGAVFGKRRRAAGHRAS